MQKESPVAVLSRISRAALGVFRGREAVDAGVSRNQLMLLRRQGVIERMFPDTYRMASVAGSHEQSLRAALLWAGARAAAAGRSAGDVYGLEGVRADVPEIVLPTKTRAPSSDVVATTASDRHS